MPTRNINLTAHLDRFVKRSVSSGHYQNASEVVRDGLRLLQQKAREDALKLERLREAAAIGFDAIDRGEFQEFGADQVRDTIAAIGRRAADRARRTAG